MLSTAPPPAGSPLAHEGAGKAVVNPLVTPNLVRVHNFFEKHFFACFLFSWNKLKVLV